MLAFHSSWLAVVAMLRLILTICFIHYVSSYANRESELYKRLHEKYDKYARPAPVVNDTVHVEFGLELQQIIDVILQDEKNQMIKLNAWLHFEWVDYRLTWDPEDFGDIHDLRFPCPADEGCMLWKPDILLWNSVDPEFDTFYPSNMIVNSTGGITWIPPGITGSSCKMNIKYFPFDDQICWLKFGSWTFGKHQLTVHKYNLTGISTESYYNGSSNKEWILIATPVKLYDYEYLGVWYQSFEVFLHLRRRTLYYAFNIIIPSLLITAMSLVGFSLPLDSGEKIALEVTVLATLCVCFELLQKMTPRTSDAVPLLGIFYFCHMVIVTISTISSVFILNLNYRTVKTHFKMGDWTKKILLNWLPWLLLMERPNHNLDAPPCIKARVRQQDKDADENRDDWCHICQLTDGAHHGKNRVFIIDDHGAWSDTDCQAIEARIEMSIRQMTHNKQGACKKSDEAIFDLLNMLQQLYDQLKTMTAKAPEEDEEDDAKNDWEFAGMVIDRLCLILFTVFITFSTCIILFSAPYVMA